MPTRRFTTQDKMNILTMLHSGVSKKSLSRLVGVEKKEITIWDLRFRQYGMQGLVPMRRRHLTPDFKQRLVSEYLQGGISMREMAAKHGVCLSSMKNWLRQYRTASKAESINPIHL